MNTPNLQQLDGSEKKNYQVKSFKIKYSSNTPPPTGDILITSPERVCGMVRSLFDEFDGGMTVEHFAAIFVNCQNEMLGFKVFNTGTVDQVAVYPRMIIHTGLMVGASGIILVHNHPSGYCDPSENDKTITRAIKEAGRLFDIRILDHIIISKSSRFSMLESGLL